MTADEGARTGERLRQKWENIRQRDAVDLPESVTVGRALIAMTLVPTLDWPRDLFADAYADDDEWDDELTIGERVRASGRQSPRVDTVLPVSGDVAYGPVIWRRVPAHGSALAGVAP
jgi:hypothetical protein